MFTTVGLISAAFSVYLPYIISSNNFTNTQTSTLITIRSLVAFIALFLITKYYEKFDIRLGVTLAGLTEVIAFFLWGFAKSYTTYAVAACFAGIAYGLGCMVPVTIIINRWFQDKKALALGICAAGTGVASIIVPPVITVIIERASLKTAFIVESCFVLIAFTVIFAVLKNWPETHLAQKENSTGKTTVNSENPADKPLAKSSISAILFATLLMGAIAGPGNVHLAVLFKTEGYGAMKVAYIVSTMGLALTFGKVLYGWVTDKTRTYFANYIFFSLAIAGFFISCLAGLKNDVLPFAAVTLMGMGLSLGMVGLPMWASDLSGKKDFANNLKRFQITYVFGNMIFSSVPGIIADYSGSYVTAYAVFLIMAVVCLITVQVVYVKNEKHK